MPSAQHASEGSTKWRVGVERIEVLDRDVRRPRLHVLNDEDVAQRLEIRIECLAIEGALIKLANVVHDRLDRRLCGNVTCIASQYHAEQEWILASELLVLVIFEDEEPIVVVLRHIEGDLFVSENGYGPATATEEKRDLVERVRGFDDGWHHCPAKELAQRYRSRRVAGFVKRHRSHRNGRNTPGSGMMDLLLVNRRAAARQNVLTKLIVVIELRLDTVPNLGRLLPFVNEAWFIACKNPLWVKSRQGYHLAVVQLDKAFLEPHAGSSLAAKLWS